MPRRIKVLGTHTTVHPAGVTFYSINYHASPKIHIMEADTFDESKIIPSQSLTVSFDIILSKYKKMPWTNKKVRLTDFRPDQSPYVPVILKVLVLNIEMDCHKKNRGDDLWFKYYHPHALESEKAKELLRKPVDNPNMSEAEMTAYLKNIPMRVQISMMKEFISLLSEKLLLVPLPVYAEISKRPLYDSMYRVNPVMRDCVAQIVMRLSRLQMDTLSFMMIHILHLWEYSVSPQITKVTICDFFGPIIIGFQSKVLIPKDSSYKTAEAAILTAVMDATNSRMWNNYGAGKLFTLFKLLTPFEEKRVCNKPTRVSIVMSRTLYSDFVISDTENKKQKDGSIEFENLSSARKEK